jgi:hypothetical protein
MKSSPKVCISLHALLAIINMLRDQILRGQTICHGDAINRCGRCGEFANHPRFVRMRIRQQSRMRIRQPSPIGAGPFQEFINAITRQPINRPTRRASASPAHLPLRVRVFSTRLSTRHSESSLVTGHSPLATPSRQLETTRQSDDRRRRRSVTPSRRGN